MTRMAVLDLGSATINLLVADVSHQAGKLRVARVRTDSVLVDLGRSIAETGGIGERAGTLLEGIARLVAGAHDAEAVLVVGTAALRTARDGPAVIADIEHRFGLTVRLLTDVREGELGVLGCRDEIERRGRSLFVDMGGGSTEVVLLDHGSIRASRSLPLGVSLLSAGIGDPIDPVSWANLGARVDLAVGSLPDGRPTAALSIGGSARRLATIATPRQRDGRLTREAIGDILDVLLAGDAAASAAHYHLDADRVHLLAPGARLLGAILDHYGLRSTRISPHGLREGVLRAATDDPDGWWGSTG